MCDNLKQLQGEDNRLSRHHSLKVSFAILPLLMRVSSHSLLDHAGLPIISNENIVQSLPALFFNGTLRIAVLLVYLAVQLSCSQVPTLVALLKTLSVILFLFTMVLGHSMEDA